MHFMAMSGATPPIPWAIGCARVQPKLAQPVVIVGGTGLYFAALTDGLADIPPTPPAVRPKPTVA